MLTRLSLRCIFLLDVWFKIAGTKTCALLKCSITCSQTAGEAKALCAWVLACGLGGVIRRVFLFFISYTSANYQHSPPSAKPFLYLPYKNQTLARNSSQLENPLSLLWALPCLFTYKGWSVTKKSPTIPLLYSYRTSGFVFSTDGKNELSE